MNPRKLSKEQEIAKNFRTEMTRMYNKGTPVKEFVAYWNKNFHKLDTYASLETMHDSGMTQSEIAKEFGVTQACISLEMKRRGLQTRHKRRLRSRRVQV